MSIVRTVAILLTLAGVMLAGPSDRAFAQERRGGPAPLAIVSIGPKNLNFGKANLIIKGTGFTQGAVVMLEGAPLQTRYFSSKKLTAAGASRCFLRRRY